LPLFDDQMFFREFVICGGPERPLEIATKSSGDRSGMGSLFLENLRIPPS
jgi:hypothetical protein